MNIGIYLGTFNPPHIGHLNCLYQALDTKVVDKIVVVPAFWNPWKAKPSDVFDPNNHEGMSLDEEHHLRCKLCEAMFKDLIDTGEVYVSDIEYELWRRNHKYAEDCIYSHETLLALNNRPSEWLGYWDSVADKSTNSLKEKVKFFLITSVETLVSIPDWKNGQWILSSFPILAMKSKHLEKYAAEYVHSNEDVSASNLVKVRDVPTAKMIDIPIHSTEIRDRFLKFKCIMPYVNKETKVIMSTERAKLTRLYESIAKHKS